MNTHLPHPRIHPPRLRERLAQLISAADRLGSDLLVPPRTGGGH